MVSDRSHITQPTESIQVASTSDQIPIYMDMDSSENTLVIFAERPSIGPMMRAKARV
jgi:hypothetical protein